ncbi:MAG: arsenite methyltransferase [Ignavibacteriaceae bacterium]
MSTENEIKNVSEKDESCCAPSCCGGEKSTVTAISINEHHKSDDELKNIVKEKYGEIARNSTSCCGGGKASDYSMIGDEYKHIDGYVADADLHLGCGVPTEFAGIKRGDTIVDLGSGAGNDVFVARALAGNEGKVIGVDMTQEMIYKANMNNDKVGYNNVDFRLGEIENLPIADNIADVIISNCVLNLVPNKTKAFAEIFRVLKPGAHFCVSDIVIKGTLPAGLKNDAEMYAGCVAGAIQQDDYLNIIKEQGFINVEIKQAKETLLPAEVLKKYLSDEEIINMKKTFTGIYSITVVGYKP